MPKTILLVDDDQDAREIFGAALADAGYNVVTGVHGAEGVHLARKLLPDLILMDLRMPVMDGSRSLQYLRSDPKTRPIAVWAISAFLGEEDIPSATSVHFNRMIPKPLAPQELVNAVVAFLGRSRKGPASTR